MLDWKIFKGTGTPHNEITRLPDPPPWREYHNDTPINEQLGSAAIRGKIYQATENDINMVNAALYLRRPLLITGKPGSGKSSLAYAVAYELQLGPVLQWPITTRSTLQEGLYRYDAIARLQEPSLHKNGKNDALTAESRDIGRYIRLGPLGTAMLPVRRPRVLLIDEIDKSDIDLPNDLLNIFELGSYEIPELSRLPDEPVYNDVQVRPHDSDDTIAIHRGRVACHAFPFVILTSNGEREFPPAFLRRCLRLKMDLPKAERLVKIVEAHFGPNGIETGDRQRINDLIKEFVEQRDDKKEDLATDQLLNAIYFLNQNIELDPIRDALWEALNSDDFT